MRAARSLLLAWSALAVTLALAQEPGSPATGPAPDSPSLADDRQVTVFGVLATPGSSTIDPDLVNVTPQLRKLYPNHGFRLLGAKNGRLGPGEILTCDLGDQTLAAVRLDSPRDRRGKVHLRFLLESTGEPLYATTVVTPANQLFFCNADLADGSKLVIGIGAR